MDDRRLILIEQQIIELASRASELIFRTSGSSASNKGQRIERYFRDLNMVRTHVTLQFERTWENVGQMRLGADRRQMRFWTLGGYAVFAAFAAARALRRSLRARRAAATRSSPARWATMSASSPLGRNGSARTQAPSISAAAQISPSTSATMHGAGERGVRVERCELREGGLVGGLRATDRDAVRPRCG